MRMQLFVVLVSFLVAGRTHAQPAQGDSRADVGDVYSREAQFQIPAQSLATALIAFSDQAHLQVIASGEEVAKSFAAEVRGRRRVIDALATMLEGTGPHYTVLSGDTISIHPKLPVRSAEAAHPAGAPAKPAERAHEPDEDELEVIIVTATRVIRDGYEAPTPTTVMGTETLKVLAASNVADATRKGA